MPRDEQERGDPLGAAGRPESRQRSLADGGAESLLACQSVTSKMLTRLKLFTQEVRTELGKVSWTGRQQLIDSTKVVLVSVCLLALFIWICDVMFSTLLQLVIR